MRNWNLVPALLAAVAVGPVFAEDSMMKAEDAMMKCDEASMMATQQAVDVADAMKKETAMKEMDMAKEAQKLSDPAKCAMHLDSAMKAAKGM